MTYVRDRTTDSPPFLCLWADCERPGQAEISVRVKGVIHIFCSERHLQLWLHGHRSYGNLPTGLRGLIT